MLTSGMVPALFPDDEKEAIIGQVQSAILISGVRSCNAQSSVFASCEKTFFQKSFQTAQVFACYSGFTTDRAVQHK